MSNRLKIGLTFKGKISNHKVKSYVDNTTKFKCECNDELYYGEVSFEEVISCILENEYYITYMPTNTCNKCCNNLK